MHNMTIKNASGDHYDVTVNAARTTTHRVTCTPAMIERYAPGTEAETLLRASFEFLLVRESNTSILATFDLPVIERYFPEYPEQIHTHLQG